MLSPGPSSADGAAAAPRCGWKGSGLRSTRQSLSARPPSENSTAGVAAPINSAMPGAPSASVSPVAPTTAATTPPPVKKVARSAGAGFAPTA